MEASPDGPFLFHELVDMIIDHLHSDKSTLAVCSLVSRTWRNSGQFHLLESVTLLGVTSEKGLEEFLACAQQSPRIRRYVRALRVHGEGSWFGKYDDTELHELCLGPQHLRSLAEMPALRRLCLFDLLWDSHRDGPESLSLIRQTGVTRVLEKLVLQRMTSYQFQEPGEIHHGIYAQDVLDILSFFSEIGVLYFSTPRFEVDGCEVPLPHVEDSFLQLQFPPRLRVGALVTDPDALDNVRSSMAYSMLDRVCRLNGLHTFRAKIKLGDIETVSHFVLMRASSLRHYQLDMSAYFSLIQLGAKETFTSLCLSLCPNLETFELRTPCYPPEQLWQYILVALSKLPSTIRRITICVYLTSTLPDNFADACAGHVDANLEYMQHFPRLEALEFVLKHPYGSDVVYPYRYQKCKRMIEELVPEPLRKRVLRIEPCECFLVPMPEPLCLSVLTQNHALF